MKELPICNLFDKVTRTDEPLDFQQITGLKFLLNLNLNGNDLCSDCAPHVQFTGDCHTYQCSNSDNINALLTLIGGRIMKTRDREIEGIDRKREMR
jgi:hypothetical protein